MSWEQLREDADYEIFTEYPHEIRKKSNGRIIAFSRMNTDGYLLCALNGKTYYVHRVIANNFIPNPENKPFVDHINHIRDDYHIDNLRWVDRVENNNNIYGRNGIPYEFVDELERECYPIDYVGQWGFENYYVCGTNILYFDGVKYRILLKHPRGKQWCIQMRDDNRILRIVTKKRLEAAMAENYNMEFDLD